MQLSRMVATVLADQRAVVLAERQVAMCAAEDDHRLAGWRGLAVGRQAQPPPHVERIDDDHARARGEQALDARRRRL